MAEITFDESLRQTMPYCDGPNVRAPTVPTRLRSTPSVRRSPTASSPSRVVGAQVAGRDQGGPGASVV
jgi:hypothetical protein